MKDHAMDALRCKGVQERAQKRAGDAAPPPRELDIDVEHDRLGAELQVVGAGAWTREDRPQLDTGAANDGRGRSVLLGDPCQVLAARQRLAQVRGRRALEGLV